MTKAFIITEGKSDQEILRAILPAAVLKDVDFVAGAWRSSAISLACSILATEHIPVALVLDTDTIDSSEVREDRDFLQMTLGEAAFGTQFAVFLAVPEIEILFLADWEFVSHQIGKNKQDFSPIEIEYAQLQPKKFLFSQLEDMPYPQALTQLLARMDGRTLSRIRQYPLVRDLSAFLLSVIEKKPDHSRPLPAVHETAT